MNKVWICSHDQVTHAIRPLCLISLFRSEKIQSLMRGDGKKKHLRKKNIETIFGKVNEGDEIEKTSVKFLEKLIRATK